MGIGAYTTSPIEWSDETLPGLRALAREALSGKSSGSDPAPTELTEIAQCSVNSGSIEFAWRELGPGSWLVSPESQMIHELWRLCPNLERVVFPELPEEDVTTLFAPVVAQTMPHLRHLDLTHISDQPLGTCCLVRSCKDLISLNIERLMFDPRQLAEIVVSEHGHSLESLHIQKCTTLSSQQLNLILSSCRRLKSLYALTSDYLPGYNAAPASPMLDTGDMAMVPEEPGWSCRDMETLQLCYSGEKTVIGIPDVLWRQIAQLSKLKDLRLLRHGSCEHTPVQEKESVRQAMSSWLALSDLRRLELRGLNAFVNGAMIKQAKNQWAKLEWIRYTYD
ncbi:hypothetical protein EC968_001667 [Mortierella alpina]|nr:hypothetical protein EC968_001667 [Mortierella alpina]